MEAATLVFLSSGLFLGWSLGANHLGNVFGAAVGTRMVPFAKAAALCSVFVVLGSVLSGAGPAHTLVTLGAVNALAGAFMVAFSAAVAVYWMTKLGMPVSTTETLFGAIIGWNLFTGFLINLDTVVKILLTWVVCPILAAGVAIVLYQLTKLVLKTAKPHLLRQDVYTRLGLVIAGSFGAYSLGANNIANVMGVFVPVSPFTDVQLGSFTTITSIQQLFLIGSLAIAVGVVTYSKRVIQTVGRGLFNLTPVTAWVVVMSHSVVLFLFASEGLEHFLASNGLPTIPLVPVSSSQAVVGAVIGIGLIKGGSGIRWRVAANIASAWVTSPFISGTICFVGLFFVQNVFNQPVYRTVAYELSAPVLERLEVEGINTKPVLPLVGKFFAPATEFKSAIEQRMDLNADDLKAFVQFAEINRIEVDARKFGQIDSSLLTENQRAAVEQLVGKSYDHSWMFDEALARLSAEWEIRPDTTLNKLGNRALQEKRHALHLLFREEAEVP